MRNSCGDKDVTYSQGGFLFGKAKFFPFFFLEYPNSWTMLDPFKKSHLETLVRPQTTRTAQMFGETLHTQAQRSSESSSRACPFRMRSPYKQTPDESSQEQTAEIKSSTLTNWLRDRRSRSASHENEQAISGYKSYFRIKTTWATLTGFPTLSFKFDVYLILNCWSDAVREWISHECFRSFGSSRLPALYVHTRLASLRLPRMEVRRVLEPITRQPIFPAERRGIPFILCVGQCKTCKCIILCVCACFGWQNMNMRGKNRLTSRTLVHWFLILEVHWFLMSNKKIVATDESGFSESCRESFVCFMSKSFPALFREEIALYWSSKNRNCVSWLLFKSFSKRCRENFNQNGDFWPAYRSLSFPSEIACIFQSFPHTYFYSIFFAYFALAFSDTSVNERARGKC